MPARLPDGVGPQPPAHLEPVDPGQADVEHDEAGPFPLGRRQPVLPGGGLEDPEPLLAEVHARRGRRCWPRRRPPGSFRSDRSRRASCHPESPVAAVDDLLGRDGGPGAATARARRGPASPGPPPRWGGTSSGMPNVAARSAGRGRRRRRRRGRRGPRRRRSAAWPWWRSRSRRPSRGRASGPRPGRPSPCRVRRSGRGRPPWRRRAG